MLFTLLQISPLQKREGLNYYFEFLIQLKSAVILLKILPLLLSLTKERVSVNLASYGKVGILG